jgi:hypothetical protein
LTVSGNKNNQVSNGSNNVNEETGLPEHDDEILRQMN